MSIPNTPPPYRTWLEDADEDASNARTLARARRPSWRGTCFNAQQAAEKTLKAYLLYHGQQPRRTHVLEDLLQECVRYDATLASLMSDCALLTPHAVLTRYPDTTYLPVTKQEARDALAAMERIRVAVLALLPA